MNIKKKIAVWCLLCALMVALVPTCSTKAEEVTTYTDLNDWLGKSGRNFPVFDLKEGASYLFVFANHGNEDDLPGGYYVLEVLNDTKTNYFYGNLYMSSKKAVNYYYLGYSLLSDYSNFSWTIKKSVESTSSFGLRRYGDSYINIHYTDRIIYEDSNYRAVSNYSNKPLKEVPSVPSAIKKRAESYIVGRMSPLRKAYAQEPFILVSSGQPFLRASDRCIGFLDSDMSYLADVELWLVDDNGEWYLSNTSLNAHCGSDVTGVALEYAPEVVYTNKTIYLQDETSAEMALSSEVYASINTDDSEDEVVPSPTVTPSVGVQSQLLYLYTTEFQGTVITPYASIYEVTNGSDDDILCDLLKGMNVTIHGWTVDSGGNTWYYCTYTNVYEGEVTGEFTGFVKGDSVGITYGAGDTTEEQDMTLAEQLQIASSLVLSVPLIIGSLFSFMPPWCLTFVGLAFSITALLLVLRK